MNNNKLGYRISLLLSILAAYITIDFLLASFGFWYWNAKDYEAVEETALIVGLVLALASATIRFFTKNRKLTQYVDIGIWVLIILNVIILILIFDNSNFHFPLIFMAFIASIAMLIKSFLKANK